MYVSGRGVLRCHLGPRPVRGSVELCCRMLSAGGPAQSQRASLSLACTYPDHLRHSLLSALLPAGWGLVVCVASMLIAAWVENARLERDSICYSGGGSSSDGSAAAMTLAAAGGALDAAAGGALAAGGLGLGLGDCSRAGPKMSVWYQVRGLQRTLFCGPALLYSMHSTPACP